MARALHKLSDLKVRSLGAGRHSDGGGLYLRVSASGGRSWSFMYNRDGQRREMGLGPYPALGLAAARKLAIAHRETVAAGATPSNKMADEEMVPTFAEVVEMFLGAMEDQWSNPKHRAQWRMTLGPSYCKPLLKMRVSEIALDDVLRVLKPHWTKKPETASRLRGRIERVLSFAKVRGWRQGENPAQWRGNLDAILPPRAKMTRGHMEAMPYATLPDFVVQLRETKAVSARALEFAILTGARSGEVLGATWAEIDLDAALWVIPAQRMKARREHRVPLTEAAMAILRPLYETRLSDYVFPGVRAGRPMSDMTLTQLMRRMGETATVHGMRSALRDWAGDETAFPREVAEGVLAHVVGNATERAYRRSDALEKRRGLLEAWAGYLEASSGANVVTLAHVSNA